MTVITRAIDTTIMITVVIARTIAITVKITKMTVAPYYSSTV